jgi:hypothetical protein
MLIRTTIRVGEDPVTRLLTLFIAFVFGVVAAAAPVPRERIPPDEKAIKKRFYDCWHEVWVEEGVADGTVTRKTKPYELIAMRFHPDEITYWLWSGELSPSERNEPRIDSTKTPMWLDIVGDNRTKDGKPESVIPCVFKFEGERLVIARPAWPRDWAAWNATGEYPQRPTGFDPRPGVVVIVMERCEYLEQYSPPPQVPERR